MDIVTAAGIALSSPQYGTGMHWPTCRAAACTGCLPPLPPLAEPCRPQLDLSLFRSADPD